MKPLKFLFCLVVTLKLTIGALIAQSNVYSSNVVGYVNRGFSAGDNFFCNPLLFTNNSLSSIIQDPPPGTAISLWNAAIGAFTQTSVFNAGVWSFDLVLLPGQGARLNTPVSFSNTFVGAVLMPDGSPDFVEPPFPLPPPYGGPDGIYLLSCKTPMQLTGNDVFYYIFGRMPLEDEQVMTFDSMNQLYHTTTFAGGEWDNGDPLLRVSDAAFFNVGPLPLNLSPSLIPEPSCVSLAALLGLGFLTRRRNV